MRAARYNNKVMALKICSLASGSKGNCIFIGSRRTSLLIDAGVSPKRIAASLEAIGESLPAHILLSHTHSDHFRYVPALCEKGMTLHYGRPARRAAERIAGAEDFCGDFCIGDITVSPFAVSHDVPCYGFSFYSEGSKVTVVTDLGFMPRQTLEAMSDSDAVLIESNYDEHMLAVNPNYPAMLKARISGSRGHLSNTESAECTAYLAGKGVKHILLGHLSEQNNTPSAALGRAEAALAKYGLAGKASLAAASQHEVSEVIEVS